MVVERLDDFGVVGCMRFNMLHPPFDNVKLRRALLPAINQADFMNAAMGGDPELTRIGVGVFTPGSPLANTAGLETLTGPRDLALAKKLVAESGYNGEKIVFIAPTDYPVLNAECLVGADLLGKLGINVELQSMDWGTMIQRRNNKDTTDKGGWSAFCTGWEGLNLVDPGAHYPIAGTGEKGWFGWFSSPKMEALRTAWFDAPDFATQKKVAEEIQLDVWRGGAVLSARPVAAADRAPHDDRGHRQVAVPAVLERAKEYMTNVITGSYRPSADPPWMQPRLCPIVMAGEGRSSASSDARAKRSSKGRRGWRGQAPP